MLSRGSAFGILVVGALGLATPHFVTKMPPVINDVATDLEDTPAFTKATVGDLPEPFKEQIKKAYADLKPLVLDGKDKSTVFDAAAKLAEEHARWEVTHKDAEAGIIEGVATTGLLRFKDDFVVRVKDGEGSSVVVDMRSKSRVGKSDLGANAARIREYFDSLSKAVSSEQPSEKPSEQPSEKPSEQ